MSPCDPSGKGLADFLEAHRDDITRRWEERVREVVGPQGLSRGELVDTLPEFLAALMRALRGSLEPTSTLPASSTDTIAEAHGRQRYRVGVGLCVLLREYSVLRDVILEVLQEGECPLDLQALRLLFEGLSRAGEEALRHYTQEHEQALRASEAELRQSEARYRLATLATSDAVWDWDMGTNQVLWSENIHRLAGYQPMEVSPALGWWAQHIHPEDRQRVLHGVQSVLNTGRAHWMDEYRFQRGDGSYIFVADRAYVVRDAHGRAVRMVGAMQDISERKVAEQQARQRADFEQHLIGIVSHDLRNPLSAIIMAATLLLRQGRLDEPQRRAIQRIVSSAERATRMLRDLLDFTQARLGGSIPVHPQPLDLHELTRQVVEEVQLTHPERQLVLEQSGDGQGEGDADRLAQLITNLVNNALTYGSEHCAVRVRTQGQPDVLLLSVHNTGEPIPAEQMGRLFHPLKRGENSGAPGSHSIGLGLFIVKHIVDAHGGSIAVHSTQESGTTFTVSLPRRQPRTAEPPRS